MNKEKEAYIIANNYMKVMLSKAKTLLQLYRINKNSLTYEDIQQEIFIASSYLSKKYKNNPRMSLRNFLLTYAPKKAVESILNKYTTSLIRIPNYKYYKGEIDANLFEGYLSLEKMAENTRINDGELHFIPGKDYIEDYIEKLDNKRKKKLVYNIITKHKDFKRISNKSKLMFFLCLEGYNSLEVSKRFKLTHQCVCSNNIKLKNRIQSIIKKELRNEN